MCLHADPQFAPADVGGARGAAAVLPVNMHGTGLRTQNPDAAQPSELMLQTLSNLPDGSRLLWLPCAAAYVFCGYTCWLLRLHFRVRPAASGLPYF